jgi:DNA polymerase sigma
MIRVRLRASYILVCPSVQSDLTVDNFEKVVCVAAAKVPVVKIWDTEL